MDFEKICMVFTMQEPYYGILLSSMERIPDRRCPTMGVGRSGNVFRLYYNPDFVEQFDLDTMLEFLKHEILHVAFNHFGLWEDPHPAPDVQKLRNIAADIEVNGYLNKDRIRGIDLEFAENYGWDNFLGTREYYSRLIQQGQPQSQPQMAMAKMPQMPCNGGMGGQQVQQQQQGQSNQNQQQNNNSGQGQQSQQQSQQQGQGQGQGQSQSQQQQQSPSGGNTPQLGNGQGSNSGQVSQQFLDSLKSFDDHSQWPECGSDVEKDMLEQTIEEMLCFAADEVEKNCGTVPGELAGKIKMIRERKRPKPVADWKRYFRRYLGNEFSEFIRKSKKRESRRFPDAAGNRHRRKSHILVAIDTSGSVSMPEYREFFGQIKTLTPVADFHVVECDARIQYEYQFRNKPNETLHGGGGTNFQPVIDLFNKHRKEFDALVYFTDGYCWIPNDTPKDTLWVVSSNGDQSDRNKYRVNGASVAFIPKHQD